MEALVKVAWLSLIVVHIMPALVLFVPSITDKLYGFSPDGDVGILIIHRGALFLAIIVAALFAIFNTAARPGASVVIAVSIIGFLFVYIRAGAPMGPLRSIAIADVFAILPLAFVSWHAWRV